MKKYTGMLLLGMMLTTFSWAWNIGAKGRVNGPTIHTSYFLTPTNQLAAIRGQAYIGYYQNGYCQSNGPSDLGNERLRTGDFYDFDGFLLKATMGGGYNCITMYYYYKQLVTETFLLLWDGFNYVGSIPATSEVQLF